MLSVARLRRFWHGVGWFGIALLLYLSLMKGPPEIPFEQGDKFGHGLAYAVLMYWWAQLLVGVPGRLLVAAGLVALGIALEYVQGWTGWRSFEYADMMADALGTALGGVLAVLTPNLLAWATRWVRPH